MKLGRARLADVTDGTSNTIMIGEVAGRHQRYARGVPLMPNTPGSIGWILNAAWADYNTAIRVRGYSNDGIERGGGCCVINCTQGRSPDGEFYGFHPGVVETLRADGSVHFLKESTPPGVLAALVSRNGGEVITDN
jgi:Protein of unknown function (DUF1559)